MEEIDFYFCYLRSAELETSFDSLRGDGMLHGDQLRFHNRRAFLRDGSLLLSAALLPNVDSLFADQQRGVVRFGGITDLHYADKQPNGSRHYRETLGKLAEAAIEFEKTRPDFLVELGDLIDAADSVEVEQSYLKTINKEFAPIAEQRHYVLGNHCVDTLTKAEFLGEVGQSDSYFSFDKSGIHFIVLDSCFRSDGQPYQRKNFKWTDPNVHPEELEWLKADLDSSKGKQTIVFAHQRLDVSNNHGVRNAAEVRKALEAHGNVSAVFQGHSHKNDLKEIAGIHYCTMVAMVEGSGESNNGYSMVDVLQDGSLRIEGFRKQASYKNWQVMK